MKQWGLDRDSTAKVQAQFYFPISQVPDALMPLLARGSLVVVRTATAPQAAVAPIRGAVERFNSQIVMYGTETMDSIIADSLASRRFSMILLGAFAGLALLLSCIGIYGVISYLVGQRVHEIGIRLALGAQQRDVLRMILGEGARMALLRLGIALPAASAAAQPGTAAADPSRGRRPPPSHPHSSPRSYRGAAVYCAHDFQGEADKLKRHIIHTASRRPDIDN